MIIQEPVQAAIWHCLNHYDLQDAVFLAERLCAEVETDETIFILATCYYRSNQIHQAYWLLQSKSPRSPQCRFLLAKCAYQLKKLSEAESALTISSNNNSLNDGSGGGGGNFADIKNFDDISKEFGECACFALQLIAKICAQTERYNIAIEALKCALKLNPFLWNAFADLCNYGEKIDPNSIFQIHNSDIFNTCQGNNTNAMILMGGGICGNNIGNGVGNFGTTFLQQQNYDNSTIGSGNDLIINNNNSTNYILSTPTIEQSHLLQQQQQQQQILQTPINNTISNNMMSGMAPIIQTGTTNTTSGISIEDLSIIYGNTHHTHNTHNDQITTTTSTTDTPISRNFKYLTALNQVTPSFGILPLQSPNDSITSNSSSFAIITPSPVQQQQQQQQQQTTLIEMNQQEPKQLGKKLKSNIIRSNKDGPPLQQSKSQHQQQQQQQQINNTNTTNSTLFTHTTPRTPNNNLQSSGIGGGGGIGLGSVGHQNVRRSSRLFSNSNYSVKENSKSSSNINSSKFAQPRSPPRKMKQRGVSKISLNNEINEKDKKDKEKIETITSNDNKVLLNNSLNAAQTMAHHVLTLKKQSAEGLMSLLRELGQGYLQLSQYNCKEAIECFSSIPRHHFATSWVQSMIALAHYELREYDAAALIFKEIHENEPHRLHLMEIYSTSLWHLQREVALSALSQDLISQDKTSPITWCVAGNCFSLHKEHETAIKFFKRAVQVDPDFVYSYTLLGHELVITEELDKAMSCFRTAILKDPRHYNAWFGIGTIYSKQERYELAELHYKRALKINPKNSVIIVHIGAMQFFMQKSELALQTLNTAIAVDPKNPLCKFHRGSMYYSLGKHQEALRELEELKQIVPKESVVFYLIGKIHKNLGNVDSALMHFSWATDLDPKGANNQLKDAFDSINHQQASAAAAADGASTSLGGISTSSDSGGGGIGGGGGDGNATGDGAGLSGESGGSGIISDLNIETDPEPNSERSSDDSSTNAQIEQDPNYDSDSY